MAEVTELRNNALPYPVYGAPWGIVVPILDADGDLVTGATALDSETSKNGDTFADCTNEATEIATGSGMYYLLLTATEMTADVVSVIVKTSSSGAKTTAVVLYPRKLVSLVSGTAQGGATGYITLAASTVLFDGHFSGCLCVATIDGNAEARVFQVCTASNQQCTVTPAWNVVPDADDTYTIYLPEGRQITESNLRAISGDAAAADNLEAACDGGMYNVGGGGVVGASVTGAVGSVTGAVGSVTGDVGGNVLGWVSAVNGTVSAILSSDGIHGGPAATLTLATLTAATNAVAWNPTWDAEVESEVNDALVVHRLDELVNADSDIDGAAPPAVGSVFHELLTKTPGSFTYDQTTDSLEAISDGGGTGLTAQEVRDAMKLTPTAGDPAAGSVDLHLDDILADTGTDGVVVAAASKTGYALTAAYDLAKTAAQPGADNDTLETLSDQIDGLVPGNPVNMDIEVTNVVVEDL